MQNIDLYILIISAKHAATIAGTTVMRMIPSALCTALIVKCVKYTFWEC